MHTQFEIKMRRLLNQYLCAHSVYAGFQSRDGIHVFHSNDSAATFESNSPKYHTIVCGIPKYHTIVCGIPREVRPRF